MREEDFLWLQKWYQAQCNGDWEHSYGISIETMDNPGWSITIDLENTELEGKRFDEFEFEMSDDNWLICFIKNKKFEGRGGPLNLSEIFKIFRNWAECEA
jgi:hypothetical protein